MLRDYVSQKIEWLLEFGDYTTRIPVEVYNVVKECWVAHHVLQKLKGSPQFAPLKDLADQIERDFRRHNSWTQKWKEPKSQLKTKPKPVPWQFPTTPQG